MPSPRLNFWSAIVFAAVATTVAWAQSWVKDVEFRPLFEAAKQVNGAIAAVSTADGGYLVYGGSPHDIPTNRSSGNEPFRRLAEEEIPPIVRLDADGRWDRSFVAEISADKQVHWMAATSDGGAWVRLQPDFTFPGPIDRDSVYDMMLPVVKLKRDGSIDRSAEEFSVLGNAQIESLPDDGLLIVQPSSEADAAQPREVIRRDHSGRLDLGFAIQEENPNDIPQSVTAGEDGEFYLGLWNPLTGVSTISRYGADGQRDGSFTGPSSSGFRVLVQPDGILLSSHFSVERFDLNGNKLATWELPEPEYELIRGIRLLAESKVLVEVKRFASRPFDDDLTSVIELDESLSPLGDWQNRFPEEQNIIPIACQSSGETLVVTSVSQPVNGQHGFSFLALLGDSEIKTLDLEFFRDFPVGVSLRNVDSDGRSLFQGEFNRVNGVARLSTARLLPDGSLDLEFNPGPISNLVLPLRDGGGIIKTESTETDQNSTWQRLLPSGQVIDAAGLRWLPTNPGTKFWAETADGKLLVSHYGENPDETTRGRLLWLDQNGSLHREITDRLAPPRYNTPRIGPRRLEFPFLEIQQISTGGFLISRGLMDDDGTIQTAPVRISDSGRIQRVLDRIAIGDETERVNRVWPMTDGALIIDIGENQFDWDSPRYVRMLPEGNLDPDFAPPNSTRPIRALAGGHMQGYSGILLQKDGWPDRGLDTSAQLRADNLIIDDSGRLWRTLRYLSDDNPESSSAVSRYLPEPFHGVAGIGGSGSFVQGRTAWLNVKPGSPEFTDVKWFRNQQLIEGADSLHLTLVHTNAKDAGLYHAEVTFESGTFASDPILVELETNTTRIKNFSARSVASTDHPQIGGFINETTESRPVLIRSVGYGMAGYIADQSFDSIIPRPELKLFNSGGTQMDQNLGGLLDPEVELRTAQVGAFSGRPPTLTLFDSSTVYGSALAIDLPGGPHTVHVYPEDGVSGISLFEFYDAGADEARTIRNISLRAWSDRGDKALIGGFVLVGNGPTPVLLRAIGPTLQDFGVAKIVRDPVIRLFGLGGSLIAENDDWFASESLISAMENVSAFELPENSKDSAMLVWLQPGAYTAIVDVGEGEPGEALLEIYWVDPDL